MDVEAVAPAELALHGKDGFLVLVIDIVFVEPGEETLFEQQAHGGSVLSWSSIADWYVDCTIE